MEATRIAIIGGGIGGLFAALSLQHHCRDANLDVTIYEQAREYRDVGAGVGIGLNAAKLLHKLGIYGRALELSGFRNKAWMSFRRYDTGGEILTVPASADGELRQLSVVRAELLELLVTLIKERGAAKIVMDRKYADFNEQGDEMVVDFQNGESTTVDLVVGADGIHSTVRSKYMSDEAQYSGTVAYRCLCSISDIAPWWPLPDYATNWISPERHFITFPIGRTAEGENKILNIVVLVATPPDKLVSTDRETWTLIVDKAEVLKAAEGFNETVTKVLECIRPEPAKSLLHDRQPLSQWIFARGKVTLLGDASHAMLPHAGQGAGQAIEDGYVLGRVFQDYLTSGKSRSLADWLNVYQAVRLPRAEKVQNAARRLGLTYEMRRDDMERLSYDECLPMVKSDIANSMDWIWLEDIDASYEKVLSELTQAVQVVAAYP